MTSRSKISRAAAALSGLLAEFGEKYEALPAALQVQEWASFATEYLLAAAALETHGPQVLRSRMQLSGHAVECALKGYILASGESEGRSHDLVGLCERAEQLGCHVTELQAQSLLQLSLHYSLDLGTGTKYKSRYPTPKSELSRMPIPFQRKIDELVGSVCTQAISKVGATG